MYIGKKSDQCPSCGGDCGYTKAKGCQYNRTDLDSTGAMAHAWFGTPGAEKAINKIFPGGGEVNKEYLPKIRYAKVSGQGLRWDIFVGSRRICITHSLADAQILVKALSHLEAEA